MEDNFFLRILIGAPFTILGKMLLAFAPLLLGQVVCILTASIYFDSISSGEFSSAGGRFIFPGIGGFFLNMFLTFGYGMFSLVGFLFLLVDFIYIFRLMYQDEHAHTFFFIVAASQLGLILSASLLTEEFNRAWPVVIISLGVLWGLYWITDKCKKWLIRRQLRELELEE